MMWYAIGGLWYLGFISLAYHLLDYWEERKCNTLESKKSPKS